MTTPAPSTLLISSGALTSTSGPAPPPLPPTEAKREYEEALAALGAIPVVSNKRAKRDTMETKSTLDKLMSLAKYFPRAVHPFMDIDLVLHYGGLAHWGSPTPTVPGNAQPVPATALAEQAKYVDAFNLMMTISPDSMEVLREFYKDDTQWGRIIKRFREAAGHARQNDTSGLKHKTHYVLSDCRKRLDPPISDSTVKSDRGTNHPMLRNEIAPWSLRLKINARVAREPSEQHHVNAVEPPEATSAPPAEPPLTPEAVAALKALMKGQLTSGKPALTASKWPSCFYADGEYDPENPEKGLFRSLFLLRVLRHIWTSPSSAIDGADKLKKTCHAREHGQYFVKGRMVGYACGQARTMVSNADCSSKDGSYNYEKMFNRVVKLFEDDPTDPWVVETLQWFQKGVFGSAAIPSSSTSDSEDSDSDSEMTEIFARRAARRSTTHFPSINVIDIDNNRSLTSLLISVPYQASSSAPLSRLLSLVLTDYLQEPSHSSYQCFVMSSTVLFCFWTLSSVLRLMFVVLITLILFSAVFDTHMLLGVLYL
ncbi:hypothetical protein FB451DRAFT_1399756 [Mycena latifolia]|nr:hypothetical protein FB451DRAFT_1399756 [Mycena latifolia]